MSAAILREDADNSVNMFMLSLVSIYQWDCFMKGYKSQYITIFEASIFIHDYGIRIFKRQSL
jgi:hypothetical protein